MAEFYRLHNQIRHYEWGSADAIPGLLGLEPTGGPCAELWMGSHPGAPSRVELGGGPAGLGEFIAGDPGRFLGEKTAARYGGLPFLFKLLAAEKPLSIQAHPNLQQAREGFKLENAKGLEPNAPNRNYRDSNHKPEIVCALTPFTGMCGFRKPGETAGLLAAFLGGKAPAVLREGFAPLFRALEAGDPASALRGFLEALFAFSPALLEALTGFALSSPEAGSRESGLVRGFAARYPNDPGIIAPLYLNVFELRPGEAVFLDAGVLHAYVRGFGVELMANSDNVLRGGLTPKHVDVPELMKVLSFAPLKPEVMKPAPGDSFFTYPAPCEEFSLTVMRGQGGPKPLAMEGPSICVVTEGEAGIGGELLRKGESIFVPPPGPGDAPPTLGGFFTLYAASTGKLSARR